MPMKYDIKSMEMIYDVMEDRMHVIPADVQGLLITTPVGKAFAQEYPECYYLYVNWCATNQAIGGELLEITNTDGIKFLIMFNMEYKMGALAEGKVQLLSYTKQCLDNVKKHYADQKFISTFLADFTDFHKYITPHIRYLELDWLLLKS